MTDQNGAIQVQYSYDPWGNLKSTTGTLVQPFRYAGYYSDDETGLIYLKSRYYSPTLGRFLTRDAYRYIDYKNPQTMNLYAYAGDNPVSNVDPDGCDPDLIDAYRQYLEENDFGFSDEELYEWFDANNPTPSGTFTDDDGNSYDYWNLTVSGGPGSISLIRDRFGNYFRGSGLNEGKSWTGISVSFMFGQDEGGFKHETDANDFLTGYSTSVGGGCFLGAARSYSGDRVANEAGFFTPQGGVSIMHYTKLP